MSHTLLISDLHLSAMRPHIEQLFLRFLDQTARQADALYILGDLFDYWAGDDDLDDPQYRDILAAMSRLTQHGTRLYVMHGNRDFLLLHRFAQASGATLLPDPTLLDFYGKRVLLTHGDELCTKDTEYQQFRRQVRDPTWQQTFLAQPLAQRKSQIDALRTQSEQKKSYKPESIMDVTAVAVDALLRHHDYPDLLIHGHTHHPGIHDVNLDGHVCRRLVLGDWYDGGNYLRCDLTDCTFQQI